VHTDSEDITTRDLGSSVDFPWMNAFPVTPTILGIISRSSNE
jgi:hypothetical protein